MSLVWLPMLLSFLYILIVFSNLATLMVPICRTTKYFSWELLSMPFFSLELDFIRELKRIVFFFLISWISFRVLRYRARYISREKFQDRFFILLILFVFSMYLLVFSSNFFILIIGWDGLGVTSFLLVIYFQNKVSLNAGMLTILTNRVGDVLIISSMAILIPCLSWSVFFLPKRGGVYIPPVFFALITVAAFTKRAQIPFSAWLPAAMAAPTPVSSLVHSSTLVTAGVFILLRFKNIIILSCPRAGNLILFRGTATMIIAGLRGLWENDLKKMVALSTLRQLGLIIACLGAGAIKIAFCHLLIHAYFKALLFMATGSLIHSSLGYQDLRVIRLPGSYSPLTSRVVLVTNFRLIGLPFMRAFYSKDLFLEMCMSGTINGYTLLMFLGGVRLTTLYSTRFLILRFSSPLKQCSYISHEDADVTIAMSYENLFTAALFGGLAYSYEYLKYKGRRLILTFEMKNVILPIILVSFLGVTLYIRSLIFFKKINNLKWTTGGILGLSILSKRFNKMTFFLSTHYLDKAIEKSFLKFFLFENRLERLKKGAPSSPRIRKFWTTLSFLIVIIISICIEKWVIHIIWISAKPQFKLNT